MNTRNAPKEQEKIAGKSQLHTETVQSRLTTKPARHSASCRVPFFIVEKSVVMVYNEPLDYSGVMGDFVKSG